MDSRSFLTVIAKNFDVLAGPLVTLVYPLYASIQAIETKSPVDDQQWLTYWVLYSFLTLFELTFATIIEWLPFWSYVKFFFNCWLVLPYFNGAAYVYQHFVRPLFVEQQIVNIFHIPKRNISTRPDILSVAERYIEQNGPEAFEELISKTGRASYSRVKGPSILQEVEVERESKSWNQSSPFFDEDYRY
ncbi:HVA22-like protein a [Typha angustifolia]|uniref:HVA22-like protein a n=1 Tax=Typha angustifolia TaxID=59011 RepID=UPI003C2F34FD